MTTQTNSEYANMLLVDAILARKRYQDVMAIPCPECHCDGIHCTSRKVKAWKERRKRATWYYADARKRYALERKY